MKSARFHMKSAEFHEICNEIRNVSFCVMIKYISFEKRKTNQKITLAGKVFRNARIFMEIFRYQVKTL